MLSPEVVHLSADGTVVANSSVGPQPEILCVSKHLFQVLLVPHGQPWPGPVFLGLPWQLLSLPQTFPPCAGSSDPSFAFSWPTCRLRWWMAWMTLWLCGAGNRRPAITLLTPDQVHERQWSDKCCATPHSSPKSHSRQTVDRQSTQTVRSHCVNYNTTQPIALA